MAPRRTAAAKVAETAVAAPEPAPAETVQDTPQPAWMASLTRITKLSRPPRTSAGRAPKPNEYLDAVRYSAGMVEGYEAGPLAFTVDSAEDAKQAKLALRRAADSLDLGLSHEIVEINADTVDKYADSYPEQVAAVQSGETDAVWIVEYQARTEKRKHQYLDKDIRAWFLAEHGKELPAGRITQEDRNTFRAAHNLPVKRKS